jgi:hypothetical protein
MKGILLKDLWRKKIVMMTSFLYFSAPVMAYDADGGFQDFHFTHDEQNKNILIGAEEVDQSPLLEKILIKIVSEPEDNRIHDLVLLLDQHDDVIHVVRRSDNGQTVFTPADLQSKEVVLARASDRDAVLLSCQGCTSQVGGILSLKYLNNGLTNSYLTFTAELRREGNEWIMYANDEDGKTLKVQTLRLRSRKVAGMLIGIRKIEINR